MENWPERSFGKGLITPSTLQIFIEKTKGTQYNFDCVIESNLQQLPLYL